MDRLRRLAALGSALLAALGSALVAVLGAALVAAHRYAVCPDPTSY